MDDDFEKIESHLSDDKELFLAKICTDFNGILLFEERN